MIDSTLLAKRIAEMNEWAKTAQAEASATHTAYCETLSSEVVNDTSIWNLFETNDVNTEQTRCKDNIDTASVITEVNGIVNRLALAQTADEQQRALDKFNRMLTTLDTPRGERKIARAPKAVKAWRDFEAKLSKEERLEFGTHDKFKKQQKRKKQLFRGKVLSVSGGLILGILASVVFGGSDA